MKQSSKHQLHSKQLMRSAGLRSDGFVLVAVLLIIALAVVLVVTTSSVSQIERKAISNSANQELARQNALFALNLAVSQLQVAAGPDQRVTATADILNTNNAQISPVAQPYWAGVWKSANPVWLSDSARTTAPGSAWFRPEPLDTNLIGSTNILRSWSTNSANMTWLVSGATNNSTISPLSSTTNWMTSSIVLASNWGTGTNGSITGATWTNPTTVTVPLVKLTNGATNVGKYAYWVSDEGVKAKITLRDTNMSTAPITSVNSWIPSLLHYFAPPAMNVSSVMTNFGITTVLTTDFRSNTNLIKMTSLGGLALITNSVPVFTNNTLAVDLTPYSYGVLSDTRMGGLRQDLTAAFESTSASGGSNMTTLSSRSGTGTGNDAVMAFRASNLGIPAITTQIYPESGTAVLDGLRWQQLYFYYNLYKSVMPRSSLSSAPIGTSPAGLGGTLSSISANSMAARVPNWTETNTGASFKFGYLSPNQIADRIDATLGNYSYLKAVGTNTVTNYSFKINYYPMVVIHNPYSVNLLISNTAVFSLTKSAANAQVSLTCSTNVVSNSTWTYYKTNTGSNVANTGSLSNSTNLFPYARDNSASPWTSSNTPDYSLLQGGLDPNNQSITNLVTMSPGEIIVFALTADQTITNMTNAATILGLVSTNNTALGYRASYSFSTNDWQGTTNSGAAFTLSIPTNTSVGAYNRLRFYPGTGNGGNCALNGWPSAINPAGYANIFPGILSSPQSKTITVNSASAQIGSTFEYRILANFERLTGTVGINNTNFFYSNTNFPIFIGNTLKLDGGRTQNSLTTQFYGISGNQFSLTPTLLQNANNADGTKTTSWGASAVGAATVDISSTAANNCAFVHRDVPIAPMTSLGQFMHLDDNVFNGAFQSLAFPAMSAGGSFASPEVDLTSSILPSLTLTNNGSSGNLAAIDNSYMFNESLFDTYFFSAVPPSSGFNWGSGGYGAFSNSSITAASIAAGLPLPNSRLVYYRKNGSNPVVADLQDESKASANLLLDGAFNVNSTSVAAWKALLTSLSGHTFHTYNYLTKTGEDRNLLNPIPRFWSVSRSAANDPWDGMRSLTDAQVTILATEIVKQVRLRGPFLSLSDFLNRRLGPTTTTPVSLVTMGAIQAAIENTQTNIPASIYDANYNIHNASPQVGTAITLYKLNGSATNSLAIGSPNYVTNTATGIPGYLMQQDIVQSFAPVLAARSDTFVIRVYGESDKPSTSLVATTNSQAWGEAVVQRLPEYFDQTDAQLASTTLTGYALGDATPPYSSAGAVLNSANQTLGRRFKIISFRWLNQNEL